MPDITVIIYHTPTVTIIPKSILHAVSLSIYHIPIITVYFHTQHCCKCSSHIHHHSIPDLYLPLLSRLPTKHPPVHHRGSRPQTPARRHCWCTRRPGPSVLHCSPGFQSGWSSQPAAVQTATPVCRSCGSAVPPGSQSTQSQSGAVCGWPNKARTSIFKWKKAKEKKQGCRCHTGV